jgi:dihydrofolate reductase
MRHFKALTTGHTIIMGRKTFESVGRPLPDRRNMVLTRDPDYRPSGVVVVHTLEEALRRADGESEVFVVGGGEIYEIALPLADRLYLTIVHDDFAGDVFFPQIDPNDWSLRSDVRHDADERHAVAFSFRLYERTREAPAPLSELTAG